MKFDARRGDRGEVFDDHGVKITGKIASCDTINGLVELYVEEDGAVVIDENTGVALTRLKAYPAPLNVVPLR